MIRLQTVAQVKVNMAANGNGTLRLSQGPTGPQGPPGEDGAAGPAGAAGEDGAPGGSDEAFAGWVADSDSQTSNAIENRIGGTIGYAENGGGAGTAATPVTPAGITGCVVHVPVTSKDVWIEWEATIGISAAGQGFVLVDVVDESGVTHGAAPLRILSTMPVTIAAGRATGKVRVGPHSAPKSYALGVRVVQEGSALAGYAANRAGTEKTWITRR